MKQANRPDPAEISLRPVTKDNYEAICDLPLPPEQQRMLADNCWSLVEAAHNPGNEGSRRLYARHGFVEQGLDAEGEDMLAVLTV